MARGRAEGHEHFPVKTKGGESVADALLSLWRHRSDDASDSVEGWLACPRSRPRGNRRWSGVNPPLNVLPGDSHDLFPHLRPPNVKRHHSRVARDRVHYHGSAVSCQAARS